MGDQATDESRQIWDSVAAGWEKERAFINELERAVTERMHEALGVRPGDTILELCAGPGEVGLRLAEQHPDAHILITDFAPGMVQAATNEAEQRGVKNVECRLVDAQDIHLPNASVDGALCRYGLMLVPDIAKAFSEVRRVLRPGGVVVYTTWTPHETNPWMMIFGATMISSADTSHRLGTASPCSCHSGPRTTTSPWREPQVSRAFRPRPSIFRSTIPAFSGTGR